MYTNGKIDSQTNSLFDKKMHLEMTWHSKTIVDKGPPLDHA